MSCFEPRALFLLFLAMVCSSAHADEVRYEIGSVASPGSIQAWDKDVRPDGQGLPNGQGSAQQGDLIYRAQCESCHGVAGIGGPFGSLVGRLEGDVFPFGTDPSQEKTIGNYWPYATTIFDYLQRAMPFNAPGSLEIDEVYSLVAYLLAENRIISADRVLNQSNLHKVQMPARDRFIPDDRRGGHEVR